MSLQAREILIMKLTNTQLIFLSVASARDDGAATFPTARPNAAAKKSASKLLALGLMREMHAEAGMPVWREEGDDRFSLVVTEAGRAAIDIDGLTSSEALAPTPDIAGTESKINAPPTIAAIAASMEQPAQITDAPRAGTKQALVVALLSKESGASLQDLMTATGWLPHTTRAALTGLRKRGFMVERRPGDTGGFVYQIGSGGTATQAATQARAA